ADNQVGMVVGLLTQGRDLVDKFHRPAKRRELPRADEHVAVPFPVFSFRQSLEDFRFRELLHQYTSIVANIANATPCLVALIAELPSRCGGDGFSLFRS